MPISRPNEFRLIARLLHSKHMCLYYKDQLFDAVQLPLRMPDRTRNCADWAKCGVTFEILTAILWFRLVEVYRRFRVTSSETFVLYQTTRRHLSPRQFSKSRFLMIKARGNCSYHSVAGYKESVSPTG
jgi:hypothetical protein